MSINLSINSPAQPQAAAHAFRWLAAASICVAAFALTACGGGGGLSPAAPGQQPVTVAPTQPPAAAAAKASVTVTVQAADGSAIAGVAVKAGSEPAIQTDAQGVAVLDVAPAQDVTLAFTKSGVANQVKVLHVPAGGTSAAMRVTMLAREAAQTLADIGAGGTLQGKDGAQASFPAGSLVDASGNVVSGAVQMQMTPVNVLANAGAFPGLFAGTQGNNAPVGIVSYGTAEFHPTQNGQKLQIAPGKVVTIEIPMYATRNPDGSKVLLGQVIPLWSLNETTGVWKQEGTGTVVSNAGSPTGLALRADVSHFSWWNCDDITGPEARINVKCMLIDAVGNATVPLSAGQTCTIRGEVPDPAQRPAQRAESVAHPAGLIDLRIPAGIPVELYGESVSGEGRRLAGMTVVNIPVGATRAVVIALSEPVATTLTQPLHGATLAEPALASAQVGAAVDKVEIYVGGNKVAQDTSEPYDFSFSTASFAEGFTTIQARSFRRGVVVGLSDARTAIIDRSAPLITLARLNATAGNGLVELRALVQDLSPIAKVEFFRGSTKIGEDSSFPFEFTYTLQPGEEAVVSFTARAVDAAGNAGVSNAITFGTQAPTVTLARAPLTNPITASQALLLSATASSTNGIARVEFFKGAIKIGEDTSAPYELSHTLTGADVPQAAFMAKAVDNAGIVATAQQSVAVSIVSTDTVPPAVTLDAVTSPITSGAVLLAATATDNVAVAKVEFYLNGVLKGERAVPETGKYRFQVDVSLLNGLTTFAAIAYDAAGNTAQSSQTATVSIAASLLSAVGSDLPHNEGACAPSMGTAADGKIYVAHSVTNPADGMANARVSRRVSGVWQSLGTVNDQASSYLKSFSCPTIAVTAAGQPYVAYEAFSGRTFGAGTLSLFVRRLTALNNWETVRELVATNGTDEIQVTIDNLSRPLITWSGIIPGSDHRLNVERFDGNAWQTLAAGFGSLGSGQGVGVFRTAVRPDNSLAIVMRSGLGAFGHAIHAVNVGDAGATSLGDTTTRFIAVQGDTSAGVSPTDIAVTANETVVNYGFANSSGAEMRTVAFNTVSNAWAQLGTTADNLPQQRESALAFQGGSLVQVVPKNPTSASNGSIAHARRWNGSSWSALTPLFPIASTRGNLHVFGGNLFMVYMHDSLCCGGAGGVVARLNVP